MEAESQMNQVELGLVGKYPRIPVGPTKGDSMTQKYFRNLLLIVATARSSSAFAGGIECKTCPCPEGVIFVPKTDCHVKTAGTFCINDNGHILGWSISNENTYRIDSLAGKPAIK